MEKVNRSFAADGVQGPVGRFGVYAAGPITHRKEPQSHQIADGGAGCDGRAPKAVMRLSLADPAAFDPNQTLGTAFRPPARGSADSGLKLCVGSDRLPPCLSLSLEIDMCGGATRRAPRYLGE